MRTRKINIQSATLDFFASISDHIFAGVTACVPDFDPAPNGQKSRIRRYNVTMNKLSGRRDPFLCICSGNVPAVQLFWSAKRRSQVATASTVASTIRLITSVRTDRPSLP